MTVNTTGHQRIVSSFDAKNLKFVIWKDRNFFFALVHLFFVYFTVSGYLISFPIYFYTVIALENEL